MPQDREHRTPTVKDILTKEGCDPKLYDDPEMFRRAASCSVFLFKQWGGKDPVVYRFDGYREAPRSDGLTQYLRGIEHGEIYAHRIPTILRGEELLHAFGRFMTSTPPRISAAGAADTRVDWKETLSAMLYKYDAVESEVQDPRKDADEQEAEIRGELAAAVEGLMTDRFNEETYDEIYEDILFETGFL